MELKAFVHDTLLAIMNGVSDAQKKLVDSESTASVGHGNRKANEFRESEVNFDVGLTSETGKDNGGRLEIGVNLGWVHPWGGVW